MRESRRQRPEMEWDALFRRAPRQKSGEVCTECLRPRLGGEYSCPCGGLLYMAELGSGDVKRAVKGAAKAEAARAQRVRFAARGPLSSFTKDGAGLMYLLWGGPASGKTTIALQTFEGAHVISGEMSLGPIAGYIARLKVTPASVSIPRYSEDGEGGWWDLGIPRDHYGPVLLDSATALGVDVEAVLDALSEHRNATGAPVVVISQATKDGTVWGSAKLAHAVDVVAHLSREGSRRYCEVTKNRAGQIGKVAYSLGERGAAVGTSSGYYSVEDARGGGYKLVKHPDPGAKYAEPYAWVEQKRNGHDGLRESFGGPDLALAARASSLSPTGWTEPEDSEDRRLFAEEHGLRWWSPDNLPPREG